MIFDGIKCNIVPLHKEKDMNDKQFVTQIADIDADFTQWYTDVVLKNELVD